MPHLEKLVITIAVRSLGFCMLSRSTPATNTWKGPLKKDHQFDNFDVTGGTVSCHNENLWCHQSRQSCQNGNFFNGVDINELTGKHIKYVALVSFIASHRRHTIVKLMEQSQMSIYMGANTYTLMVIAYGWCSGKFLETTHLRRVFCVVLWLFTVRITEGYQYFKLIGLWFPYRLADYETAQDHYFVYIKSAYRQRLIWD